MQLDHELPFFLIIICPNLDNLHEGLLVQYVMFGKGVMMVEPSYKMVVQARKMFRGVPILTLMTPCIHCWAKGVRGESHFTEKELLDKLNQDTDEQKGEPTS